MKLCKCGCGQKVKFENNNYIRGHNKKGVVITKETKIKIGNGVRGEKNGMYGLYRKNNPNYGSKRSEKTKIKMHESQKGEHNPMYGKIPWNKGMKTGPRSKESIIKQSKSSKGHSSWSKLTIEKIQKLYKTFAKEEEMRYNPDEPEEKEIQVHCKYSGCSNSKESDGWFTPTYWQFARRRDALEHIDGNDGCFFYCSEECKQNCCLYKLKEDPFRLKKYKKYFDQIYKETYKTVKKYPNKIKNLELRGIKHGYELDHKYTIYDGFKNNVDPKIIGHWKNLECIPELKNKEKGKKSSISLEDLKLEINNNI